MSGYRDRIQQQLGLVKLLQSSGLDTYSRRVSSGCQATMIVEGRECINFISNSYMGFSTHPKVVAAVTETAKKYGVGIGGAPLACGYTVLHEQLEERLANNYEKEAAVVFPSGYQALVGTIQGLMQRGDIAMVDTLSHRSIIDGCLLSGCKMRSFRHNSAEDLRELIERTSKKSDAHRMVIVDSVYSMDGDIAPLDIISPMCVQHNVTLMIDEAHSLGIMGKNGRGLLEFFGQSVSADVVSGTFSKFAGAVGGFTAGEKDLIDYLKHYSSPYVFSASMPPVITSAVLTAFEILEQEPHWLNQLWDNVHYMLDQLKALGFDTANSNTPVIPVMIRDTQKVLQMNRRLLDEGVYASPVVHPGVSLNQERLRLGVMATHTRQQLDTALSIFEKIGREFEVIK